MKMTSNQSKPVLILNSSTLIILYELHELDLLRKIKKKFEILIPSTVAEEMRHSTINLDHSSVIQVDINTIQSELQPYTIGLGYGELGALILAHKLRGKRRVTIITDDKKSSKNMPKIKHQYKRNNRTHKNGL